MTDFAAPRWDDPFWHVVRMVVDARGNPTVGKAQIEKRLLDKKTDAARGLLRYLKSRPEVFSRVADYLEYRADRASDLVSLMRTEDEAIDQLREFSDIPIKRYRTKSKDHYQSASVVVSTIKVLTEGVCVGHGLDVNVAPSRRAALMADDHIWVSPRVLDGALPSLLNPVGIWEIKEYWGGKEGSPGGSKMSDAIYECQLVGQELRSFEDLHGIAVKHYLILDGRRQWASRGADLRRTVDLVSSGLLDDVVVGADIIHSWPMIVHDMCLQFGSSDACSYC